MRRNRRIWFKELLPNLWAPILVYTTLTLPANISAEAALSFLGVGIKAPTPTLGNILNDSVNYLSADPIYFFLPGMFIFVARPVLQPARRRAARRARPEVALTHP